MRSYPALLPIGGLVCLFPAAVESVAWRPHPRLVVPTPLVSFKTRRHQQSQQRSQARHHRVNPPGDNDSLSTPFSIRGGYGSISGASDDSHKNFSAFDATIRTVLQVVTSTCRTLLPPTVAAVRAVAAFYAALPKDALLAQVGLVYCFSGGYFPTLFAAIQAAQHCGWEVAVAAVDCLVDEAVSAIQACDTSAAATARELLMLNTKIVMATIDPVKINDAVAALYMTWMGVSVVLEREFARTIALSVTIGDYMRPMANLVLAPPVYRCTPQAYHKWVPLVMGWVCKAAAMSVAWRIQRVLTAYSSAVAGGLMFSRSCFRMLRKRGIGRMPQDGDNKLFLEEVLGFLVAAAGLYSQIGHGISFRIPFPLRLVTLPFELAEHWIQWAITKNVDA